MKNAVKGIIGLCAALAVLGGGLAALKLTEPDETEESSSVSSEASGSGIQLIKDEEISSVRVTKGSQVLNIVVKDEKTEDSAATYTIEGYEDVPLTTAKVGTIPNNAKGLTSDSIVAENCTELSKYGFDDPQAEAEITFASGEKVNFIIGDTAPVTSETYFMFSGDDTVYTVATGSVSNYNSDIKDFVSTTILEEPDEADYPTVNSLKIQRDDLDYDIVLEYNEKSEDSAYSGGTTATHIMTQPTFSYLAVERSTAITNGMFGLSADGIYSILPGEAEIAEAGLSSPFCTVTMSCSNDTDYVLYLSEPFTDEEGKKCHYAMMKDGKVIYIVSAEDAQWGTVMPIDITSKMYFGSYVWNITDMKVSCDGVDDEFKIQLKEESADKESTSAEDYDVTRNGEPFDAERYRGFVAFLIKGAAEDFAYDEKLPSGEPMASVEYMEKSSGKTQKIEFYDYSALNALIAIDGESKYFCSKSYVETLIENAKRIETGEEYLTTWK